MRMKIMFCFGLILVLNGHVISQNYVDSLKLIGNNRFGLFISSFNKVKIPFNYKKELSKVGTSVRLKKIQKKDAIQYLKLNESILTKSSIDYNYLTDNRTVLQEENLPVAHLVFTSDNYIALIYRISGRGSDDDSTFVYLQTYDIKWNLQDKILIGEQFTPESDWICSVFLDQNHFKIFHYGVNLGNFQVKNNCYYLIDKNAPRTIVKITDYEIDEYGNIKKVKEYPVQFLKDDLVEYKKYNTGNDDIMNEY